MIFKEKKHKEIEKKYNCPAGSLKEAVKYLLKIKADIDAVVKGCEEYCRINDNSFTIAFNLYVSCLKNPKKN
jgi:transcription elongation factor Elf1